MAPLSLSRVISPNCSPSAHRRGSRSACDSSARGGRHLSGHQRDCQDHDRVESTASCKTAASPKFVLSLRHGRETVPVASWIGASRRDVRVEEPLKSSLPLDTITALAQRQRVRTATLPYKTSAVSADSARGTFMPVIAKNEIDRYLRTGDYDPHFAGWPGNFMDRARQAETELRDALIAEVGRRVRHTGPREMAANVDVVTLTRRKVEPMVRGLFARAEQDPVLGMLERSVVFLGSDNIFDVLRQDRLAQHGLAPGEPISGER